MLQHCFGNTPNVARKTPSTRLLSNAPEGPSFESRAFAALFRNANALGIKSIWRCQAARVDGYLETNDGEYILLEMKEGLGWGSMQAAGFQFLAGREILKQLPKVGGAKFEANRAIIVFERISSEWATLQPHGAWGQLALHAKELSTYIEIGGMQVMKDGSINSSP